MFDDFGNNQETIKHSIGNDPEMTVPSPSNATVPKAYSTSYYNDKRQVPPPPPPDDKQSAARERARKRRVQEKNKAGEWAWVVVAGALFGVVLMVSVGALLLVRNVGSEVEVIPTAAVASEIIPTPVLAQIEFGEDGNGNIEGEYLVLPDGSSIELSPWDGQSRFTMVLAGLDRRPTQTGLSYRTDTMMLLSLDPETNSIGVLSIPRDLYIQVPGYSQLYRVNSPMVLGETTRPGYGPELMMKSVQLNLGMRVHDYLVLDFQAFIDFVDIIGGIDVETTYVINDRAYPAMDYSYETFYLAAGQHHLMGYDALRFARTRHGSSDIQRAERQQQVIYAVRDRVLSADMVPQLLLQAPALWQSFSDNVYTGLSLEQVIQLALYAKDIPLDDITMRVMNYEFLQGYTTPAGAQVLIPNRNRLGGLMVDTFGANYCEPDCR